MTAPIDYNAVLADLEAKRGQIDAAIAVIRTLIGASATATGEGGSQALTDIPAGDGLVTITGPRGASATGVPSATGIPSDLFFRLSTAQAVKKFLSMMKRPQKPRAIADALKAGGQVNATDDKQAYGNVATALRRGTDKEFVQTRQGEWGLVEWYGSGGKANGE